MKQLLSALLIAISLTGIISQDANAQEKFAILAPASKLTGRIAFSASTTDGESIFVLDLDTKKVRPMIENYGNSNYPSWSPDGRTLAFVSDKDGRKAIYLATWDGSNIRKLSNDEFTQDHPAWSPNGEEIVFTRSKGGSDEGDADIAIVSVKTGAVSNLTKLKGRNSTPRFSPDGKWVSYSTDRFWPGWDVCMWEVANNSERCVLTGAQTYCRAAWSRSGKELAYSAGIGKNIDLGIVELATNKSTFFTEQSGREYGAEWSPDDAVLVYSGEVPDKDAFNLFITTRAEPMQSILLLSSDYSLRNPTWSAVRTIELEAQRARESESPPPVATP